MRTDPSCKPGRCVPICKPQLQVVCHVIINNDVWFGEWTNGNAMGSLNLDKTRNFNRELLSVLFFSLGKHTHTVTERRTASVRAIFASVSSPCRRTASALN